MRFGSMKPNEKFFNGFIDKINNVLSSNYKKDEIILVGDEVEKDLKGGFDNNIDVCLFKNCKTNYNYDENRIKLLNPKYEINDLIELRKIL